MDASNITIFTEVDEFRIRRMVAKEHKLFPSQKVTYPVAVNLRRESEALAEAQYQISMASIKSGGRDLSCI